MRSIISLLVTLMLLVACADKPTFEANYDTSRDFGVYQTFAWARDEPMDVFGLLGPTPRTAAKLLDGIRSNLEGKGYTFLESRDGADFLVQFTIGARDGVEVWNVPSSLSGPWWGRGYYGTESLTERYTEGKLAIDIIDRVEALPVWHGFASKRLTPDELNNPDPNVQPVIDEILSTFPPG